MKYKHFILLSVSMVLMYLTIGGITNTKPDVTLLKVAGWQFGINYSKYFIAKMFSVIIVCIFAVLVYKSSKNQSGV